VDTSGATGSEFEQTYRRHVAMVQSGDVAGTLRDVLPTALPALLEGVTLPNGQVIATDIRRIAVDGDRAVGECVYTTAAGRVGLGSYWGYDGGQWLADKLENLETA
jgi:hypothetical protein